MIQDEIFSIQEANLNDSDWLDEFERSIFSYNHKNIYRNILKTYNKFNLRMTYARLLTDAERFDEARDQFEILYQLLFFHFCPY